MVFMIAVQATKIRISQINLPKLPSVLVGILVYFLLISPSLLIVK